VGELWLDGDRLLWHEAPRARAGAPVEHPLAARFAAYFAGARDEFDDVELDLEWCTPFGRELVAALRSVGYGETVTYAELAALAGRPNAQRAAGTFCAGNRFPLVLPCHRVVSAGGIGSYGSLGVEYKRRLLELEQR
jgi:methylated-DNA-[protein]-cysteine S-methyltransferase